MAINFAVQTGTVFIKDFDEGVMRTLISIAGETVAGKQPPPRVEGIPQEKVVQDPFDTADPRRMVLRVVGLQFYAPDLKTEELIQVVFASPEQLLTGYVIPSIVVRREDVSPDFTRWHSEGALQYRIPSQQSNNVTVTILNKSKTGPTEVEQFRQAWPYDIAYTLTAIGRSRNDAAKILQRVLKAYQPYGRVFVKDSKGEVRTYEAFMEGFGAMDEVVDVTGRTVAHTINLRIAGELDSHDPEVFATMRDPVVTSEVLPPA